MSARDLVQQTIDLGAFALDILRPPDAAALIDEERFADDEFMPYWAELWSSGVALARQVTDCHLQGKRVLELGCGLGLPSLAAARGGARVLATDWAQEAIDLLAENAARNDVALEMLVCDWRDGESLVARGPWDLVLGADLLYEHRNVEPLAALLPSLGGEALLADPGRPYLEPFLERVGDGLRLTVVRP